MVLLNVHSTTTITNLFIYYIYIQCDPELSEAIEMEYYRFDPHLRHALQQLIFEVDPSYVNDLDKGQRFVMITTSFCLKCALIFN